MNKVDLFRQHLNELQNKYNCEDDDIINMDETPVWFETSPSSTFDKKGNQQIPLLVSTQDKHRITVNLAVTKSGKMLPPSIIEKSKSKVAINTPQFTLREVSGIKGWKQKSNTMTSEIMVSWINNYL